MNTTLLKKGAAVLAGAAAGFAYYYFIGCVSGTCPITSNPYISTGYGAVLGFLLTSGSKKSRTDRPSKEAS